MKKEKDEPTQEENPKEAEKAEEGGEDFADPFDNAGGA